METKQKKFRFNIIDVVVILVIVAVIAVFAVKFIDKRETASYAGVKTVEYTVVCDAVPKEMYEAIAATLPAQMAASGKYVSGTVLSAEAEPCQVKELEVKDIGNQNRTFIVEPQEEYCIVRFNCTADLDSASILNELGTQEIRVGKTHYVKTDTIELVGTIVSMTVKE
jgi:hypothetical protein